MELIRTPSPNFNERLLTPDMLVVHYTDMESTPQALAWLTNPESQLSSHYLICEEGNIYCLVKEEKRAWHAGKGFWQGIQDINSCSIGIELSNPGHSHGYALFPDQQIKALVELCLDIQTRWTIPPTRILGHSDVAPQRKQDPGHLFPWETLYSYGLGMWPRRMEPPLSGPSLLTMLGEIGYDISSPHHAILAFQRHFQPHKLDGLPNEETLTLAWGLLQQIS